MSQVINGMEMERVPFGADETIGNLSAGASTVFTFTNRRRLFRPENMVFDAASATGIAPLTITDIKVGVKSLLASAQPVPAMMFRNRSVVGHVDWPDIGISETVKVTVKNNGLSTATVICSLIGLASKE